MRPDGEQEDDGISIEEKIQNALSSIFMEHNGAMVNKYVVIVETVQLDGERGVWTFTPPDAMRWDVQGLLIEAQDFQTAHNIAHILQDHGIGGH